MTYRRLVQRVVWAAIGLLGALALSLAHAALAHAEYVWCDPTTDTAHYYCRGWQDGVGPGGTRVRFIAFMLGQDYRDDFGKYITSLGDINGDGHADFMVWVPGKCEWRIYHGDTLISKTPALVWPRCSPGFPGRFKSVPDISGDGQPDLFRFRSSLLPGGVDWAIWAEIYFAGAVFDTVPDLLLSPPQASVWFGHALAGGRDLNGDGQPDFAIGEPDYDTVANQEGRVYLFWGGSALDSIPDLILAGPRRPGPTQHWLSAMGSRVDVASSVNGDAFADLILGRPSEDVLTKDPPGEVQIFFGGPSMDTAPDVTIVCPDTTWDPDYGYQLVGRFGSIATDIGDCNRDGYHDLLIAGWQIVPAYVYFGGPAFDTSVDLRLTGPWPWGNGGRGTFVVALGDVNGDAHSDFATVNDFPTGGLYRGHVHIRFAQPNISGAVDWQISGEDWLYVHDQFGRETKSIGDVDGDGIDDIAVGATTDVEEWNQGAVYIYAGMALETTGVFDDDNRIPSTALVPGLILSCVPNPFNSSTTVALAESFRSGTVTVYDILGRRVRLLAEGAMPSSRLLVWDGRDDQGRMMASGLYFAQARSAERREVIKLVMLK